MVNISRSKKVYWGLIIQIILFFILSIKINYNILEYGVIIDIGIILALYLFYNDTLNLSLTLIASFSLTYLIENLKMPQYIRYIQDYFILIMISKLIVCIIKKKIIMKKIYVPMIIFFISTLTAYIINGGSLSDFFVTWFNDYLRYFVIFIAMINLNFPENKLMKIIKGLWYFLLLQVPIVFIQDVWSLKHWKAVNPGDIRQDYIAGILGGRGTIELGILLTIGISALFMLYVKKKVKVTYFIIVFLLFIAVICISEIKFAFFLIAFSFLIICFTNFDVKSSLMLLLSGVIIIVGINALIELYPNFKDFLTEKSITSYLNETYADSGISRADSFIIANDFIVKDFSSTAFGYGPGRADKISKTYRFSAFNISKYISELGYVGIACFYGIFISMIFISIYLLKNGKRDFEKILGTIGVILQIAIILGTFYNMPMVNITFSIIAWVTNGLIYRYFELSKNNCSYDNKGDLYGKESNISEHCSSYI